MPLLAEEIIQTQRVATTLGLCLAIGETLELRDSGDWPIYNGNASDIADVLLDISKAHASLRLGDLKIY